MTIGPGDDARERANRDEDQWRDIVDRLGDDLFDGVPDIIATPMSASAPVSTSAVEHASGATRSDESTDTWDIEEGFIPPSPALPRFSRRTRFAWALVVLGFGLLTAAFVFRFTDTWSTLIGFGAVGAGATSLIMQLNNQPPDEDDDGAVV